MPHRLGDADNLIKNCISTVLIVLLLPVSWTFLEGFDDQGKGKGNFLSLALSVPYWSVSLSFSDPSNHQLLGNIINQTFFKTDPGTDIGSLGSNVSSRVQISSPYKDISQTGLGPTITASASF